MLVGFQNGGGMRDEKKEITGIGGRHAKNCNSTTARSEAFRERRESATETKIVKGE